ncbi:MAG: TonB C-terminal domain-containing protein, partial [Vampirovibrionales bacterium]
MSRSAYENYNPFFNGSASTLNPLPDYLQAVIEDVSQAKKDAALNGENLGRSALSHVGLVLLLLCFLTVSSLLGLNFNEVTPPELAIDKQTPIEFVIVNNTTPETPRNPQTRNRAKVASRSGGVKTQSQNKREATQSSGGRPSVAQSAQRQGSKAPTPTQDAAPKAEKPAKSQKPWWQVEAPTKKRPIGVKKASAPTASGGGSPQSKSPAGQGDDDLAPLTKPASTGGGKGTGSATRIKSTNVGNGERNQVATATSVKGAGGNGKFSSKGQNGGGGGLAGVDAVVDVDMSPYISNVQRRIYRNWRPSLELSSLTSEYTLVISRTGALVNYRLKRSSGNALFEQLASSAITATTFPPLPAGYRG